MEPNQVRKIAVHKYLHELTCLSDSDETSLHHTFSQFITERDEKCVEQITAYMEETHLMSQKLTK